MPKTREYLENVKGVRRALETEWRPNWKAMGVTVVGAQIAAGRGPAVDDTAWGPLKINEARVWRDEELARLAEVERTTTIRATVSYRLSIAAVLIALAAAVIAFVALFQGE
jgi:hypothetical protein